MNLALATLVIAAATAPAVAAMLLVRRRAPEGSYFADGDRAAGVFGVLATGFSVVHEEWPRAQAGERPDDINPWGAQLFRTVRTVEPRTTSEQSAYDKWLDQTSDRESARNDRMHGAVGVIPAPLWVVLLFISVVIFVFMLFFADRGEGPVTQAVLMGSVVSVIVAMLLLIRFLDSPFHTGIGGVRPVAMERTLRIMDEQLRIAGRPIRLPCDERGAAIR